MFVKQNLLIKFHSIKYIMQLLNFFNKYKVQNILFCLFLYFSIYVIKYNIFIFSVCLLYPVFVYFYVYHNTNTSLFLTYLLFFMLCFFSGIFLYYIENVVDKKIIFFEAYRYLNKMTMFTVYVSGAHAIFTCFLKKISRDKKIDFFKKFGLLYIVCFLSSIFLYLMVEMVKFVFNLLGYHMSEKYDEYLFFLMFWIVVFYLSLLLLVEGCIGLYRYIIKESKFKNNKYISRSLNSCLFCVIFAFMIFLPFVKMNETFNIHNFYYYYLLYSFLSLIYIYIMIKSFPKSECLFLNFSISMSWIISAFIDFGRMEICFFYMMAAQFLFFIYPFFIFWFTPAKKFRARLEVRSIMVLFLIFSIMFGVEMFSTWRL